jgi:hypothetical protein
LSETIIALHTGNLVEFADGLADLRYVVLGTAAVYGIRLRDEVAKPHDKPRIERAPHLVYTLLQFFTDVPQAVYTGRLAAECLRAFDLAIADAAARSGLPLDALFWEVHRSNMSKDPGKGGANKGGIKGKRYTPPDIAGILAL